MGKLPSTPRKITLQEVKANIQFLIDLEKAFKDDQINERPRHQRKKV